MDNDKRAWRIMEAAENYLGNCANVKVDIEVLESLMEPGNKGRCTARKLAKRVA